ncbi:glucose-1-phosphate thymidylyltransferase [Candidatus Parcubacteria bacterium]|nr:glucose-1-phosphate thymidylyltransferase [Patescibacteria group bacterium]MCG2689210.1 glucose-1-phosphate thymidylyltransferase [Candidatus Parcubacteria bacterium]
MKAIITAGGRGTRLRPFTHSNNKHLLPIANKPMILYPLEQIRDAGIKEIGIIVNETRAEIENLLGDGSTFGVSLTYIFQEKPLGIGHCLKISEEFLRGTDKFVMYLGDNVSALGIKVFVEDFAKSDKNAVMSLVKVDDLEKLKAWGVAEIEGDRVVRVEEKPQNPKPNHLGGAGIYFFDSNAFKAFSGKDAIVPSNRGEYEITSGVYRYLINHGYKVGYYNITGWWKDTGRMEDLIEANRLVLDKFDGFEVKGKIDANSKVVGDIKLGIGSIIENSNILGPVVIGENVIIKNSKIGAYTAVGDNCQIVNSEIENSILMNGASLTNLQNVSSSLIGSNAKIKKNGGAPNVSSIVVGDDSVISLA